MTGVEAGINAQQSDRQRQLWAYVTQMRKSAGDKLTRRLGWMTRAHPFVLDEKRLIVPLYSDGFSFSLMAITDDWGATWHTSTPLVGAGNIQPSIVKRRDGSLYTLMRDNGPPPKRLMVSRSSGCRLCDGVQMSGLLLDRGRLGVQEVVHHDQVVLPAVDVLARQRRVTGGDAQLSDVGVRRHAHG